jgi:hypothetical protein
MMRLLRRKRITTAGEVLRHENTDLVTPRQPCCTIVLMCHISSFVMSKLSTLTIA